MLKIFKHDWSKLILAFLVSTTIFLGYYLITKHTKLDIVYKNWDGPGYVLVAKSLYDPAVAYENNFFNSGDITPEWSWLPAHFPLYPLLIRAFSFLGYFQAMLLISLGFTLAAYLALYELIKSLKITKHPFLVTFPFIFLSPRWFIVSHVGNSESAFVFFIILFLLYLHKKDHKKSAIFLALAQVTRPHAIFFALGLAIIALIDFIKSNNRIQVVKTYLPYLLIPASILVVFTFYYFQTGNFWAFFEAISLTKNLQTIPFATFTFPSANIETFWQEINAADYVIYLAAALTMFRKKFWQFGIISLTFFIPLIFLHHTDISRYAIPMLPFAFIAFSEMLEKKELTLATLLMSPAIYMYAINFMDHNHGT
ncbi:MAG: hypothetical protein DRG30_08030 [Epsilonproteobacteria bacterium]|nr:MAG: hypothetical protein DRG30_08030 [Campylobacterota bacterium]